MAATRVIATAAAYHSAAARQPELSTGHAVKTAPTAMKAAPQPPQPPPQPQLANTSKPMAASMLFALDSVVNAADSWLASHGGGGTGGAFVSRFSTNLPNAAQSQERVAAAKSRIAFFSEPGSGTAGDACSRLARDVHRFRSQLLCDDGEVDMVMLATRLASVGYNVAVRTALGGSNHFSSLRHEFLLVRVASSECEGVDCVVDVAFRDQFSIPHPTPEYLSVLSVAPEVFVGPTACLTPIVQALCGEMAESFEAVGLTLPPWRRAQPMLSKWLPAKSRDMRLTPPSTPGRSGAGEAVRQGTGNAIQRMYSAASDSSYSDDSSAFASPEPMGPGVLPAPLLMRTKSKITVGFAL